jgi:hypothetical protein
MNPVSGVPHNGCQGSKPKLEVHVGVDRRVRSERRVRVLSDRLCACGCGERTLVAMVTDRSKGWVKGEGKRFVRGHRARAVGGLRVRGRLRVAVRWVEEDRGFETPCWIWQLGVDTHGYGKVRGERLKAHRVAYEDAVGPIPAGHEVHHRCEQKTCVRPGHLQPLTPEAHGQLHGEVWRHAAC